MSARDRILGRLHHAAQAGAERPAPLRPAVSMAARGVDQFEAQAQSVQASVSHVGSLAELPAAVAAELRQRNLPAEIRTGNDPLFDRDWGTVERSQGPGR